MKRTYFTLIEILAVMTIIVLLLGAVAGGGIAASRMAKASRTQSQVSTIESILDQYRIYWGFYPESDTNGDTIGDVMALDANWWDSLGTTPFEIDTDDDGTPDITGRRNLIDNTQMQLNEDATFGYVDPYGNPFYYQEGNQPNIGMMNVGKFDLWSTGRDGAHGEAGVDDDGINGVDDAGDARTANAKDSDDLTNWGR